MAHQISSPLKLRFLLAFVFTVLRPTNSYPQKWSYTNYLNDLRKGVQVPGEFVNNALKEHDLVIFDDGLHSAKEPFDFYQSLLLDTSVSCKLDYVFIEVFNTNSQPYLDRYFKSETPDSSILLKVFQDDYSGYGWKYRTYLDLLSAIWNLNRNRTKKIEVVAVSPPVYWEAIKNRNDYEIFQNSLVSRDYFMYLTIKDRLNGFSGAKKGIFLTNTRHAYKQIKDSSGKLYWNTNTFFTQWNPGKTFSIRIHNAYIAITPKLNNDTIKPTAEGLNQYDYKFVLPQNGLWDSAFIRYGKFPFAISLKQKSSYGNSPYIGNLMSDVKKGSTQYDAYDALIVLKPFFEWHFSAHMSYFYTPEFKIELARRIKIIEENSLEQILNDNNEKSLETWIEKLATPSDIKKNQLVR